MPGKRASADPRVPPRQPPQPGRRHREQGAEKQRPTLAMSQTALARWV